MHSRVILLSSMGGKENRIFISGVCSQVSHYGAGPQIKQIVTQYTILVGFACTAAVSENRVLSRL